MEMLDIAEATGNAAVKAEIVELLLEDIDNEPQTRWQPQEYFGEHTAGVSN